MSEPAVCLGLFRYFWTILIVLVKLVQFQLYYEKEDHNQFNFSVLMAKLQETPLAKNQKRSQMVKNCQYIPVNFGQLGGKFRLYYEKKITSGSTINSISRYRWQNG